MLHYIDGVEVSLPHDHEMSVLPAKREELVLASSRDPRGVEETIVLTHVQGKRLHKIGTIP